jgi:hypothetical protein
MAIDPLERPRPPRNKNPALGGGGTNPLALPIPLPPPPPPLPSPPALPLPCRARPDRGLSGMETTPCSKASDSRIRLSWPLSSSALPVVVRFFECGGLPMWRTAGRPLRVARPALPRDAVPPRPKRTEEGTRLIAATSRVSISTSASPFSSAWPSSFILSIPTSGPAAAEAEAELGENDTSLGLLSVLWSSKSRCCDVDTDGEPVSP